ncbi:Regulator of chromosome condensation (RCC1) repeat [Carpediemonas membranifera]|uniref:Regulator of chromosome condensation (RCC1) repeat n=1 Tax=Carpediemonas membranifera TaxID=201153 RepID=A0A8J6E3Y4_9EUKA|nr:Regulator of chromosome condensation (RCC1) repeat [Carpediemonas membranifera]|eukprot:KAG9396176.1 Regulator of chromosome condensation (RCC1) repeat [Carpediemonas membranifera]
MGFGFACHKTRCTVCTQTSIQLSYKSLFAQISQLKSVARTIDLQVQLDQLQGMLQTTEARFLGILNDVNTQCCPKPVDDTLQSCLASVDALVPYATTMTQHIPGDVPRLLILARDALLPTVTIDVLGRPAQAARVDNLDDLAGAIAGVMQQLNDIVGAPAECDSMYGAYVTTIHQIRLALCHLGHALDAVTGRSPLSMNIPHNQPLPDRLYTLLQGTLWSTLHSAEVPSSAWFMCKKFFFVKNESEASAEMFGDGCMRSQLYHGRLIAHVRSESDTVIKRWVRLPPVLSVHHGENCCVFIGTIDGIYAAGCNRQGQLGVGVVSQVVSSPKKVMLPRDSDIGRCKCYQTPKPWMKAKLQFWHGSGVNFLLTPCSLMAAGDNRFGRLGVGSSEGMVSRFMRVSVPLKCVISVTTRSFPITVVRQCRACFVSGRNDYGQLSLGHTDEVLSATKLPFPVDSVIMSQTSSAMLSDGKVIVSGNNQFRLFPVNADVVVTPTALQFPWPVSRIMLDQAVMFAERGDGRWYARGSNALGQLGVGLGDEHIVRWSHVPLAQINQIHSDRKGTIYFDTSTGMYIAGAVTSDHAVCSPTMIPAPMAGLPPALDEWVLACAED